MGENQKLEKQEFDVTVGALPLLNTKKQYPRGIISYLLNIILIIMSQFQTKKNISYIAMLFILFTKIANSYG